MKTITLILILGLLAGCDNDSQNPAGVVGTGLDQGGNIYKYEDPENGVVCYKYLIRGISCVKVK